MKKPLPHYLSHWFFLVLAVGDGIVCFYYCSMKQVYISVGIPDNVFSCCVNVLGYICLQKGNS